MKKKTKQNKKPNPTKTCRKSVITDCSSTTKHETQKLRTEIHYLIKFEFESKDMA